MSWRASLSRWLLPVTLGGLLIGIVLLAVPLTRNVLLRAAGWALVAQDNVPRADVIVIAVDADGAGVLEAVDLVHAGVANRIALFADPPDAVDSEFVRRGVPYSNRAAVSTAQLHALGIDNVAVIPRKVAGTTDEGAALRGWCTEQGYHSVLFVSTTDHSRRARRMLERSLRGSGTRVIVHYSRYSEFDPDSWWRTRNGIRIEIFETEKLLADVLRHPFS
jgi:hypothetical protein